MYSGFDTTTKEETIVLSHLKNVKKSYYDDEYLSSWSKRREIKEKQKNKTEEEIEKEVEKEIYDEKEKLSKESLGKYYKIEKEKNHELEKIFKSFKSKVQSSNLKYLDNGKFWSFSNNLFTMFDNVIFKKLYEIKFEAQESVKSVIELDNNDLVFMINIQELDNTDNNDFYYFYRKTYTSYLFIYRLHNEKYILLQKIEEDITGYKMQNSYSGCEVYPKSFELDMIKKLSGNKILSISNYGIRMYALNENKGYSMILMDVHSRGLELIYEIDEKNLIFCSLIHIGASLGGPAHDYLEIEKVNLRNITKNDISNKIEKHFNKKEESGKIISSLKLVSDCKNLLEYSTYGGHHSFSNFVILKRKYFIIMIDYYLLVFDLFTGEQMARYKIVKSGEKNLYYDRENEIGKWINNNDNEFFLNINGNITLFELDDSIGINLKIIAYSYFPNVRNLIMMEDKNRFCSVLDDCILIY